MKFNFLSENEKVNFINKASTLVEALPYIREHAGKTIVIKYGGHAMINQNLSKSFSQDIGLLKAIGINPVIVHGGGPQIEKELKKNKLDTRFLNGLRITDKKSLKIVKKVLSKELNLKIASEIKKTGGKPIGLSGHLNNLIIANKIKIPKTFNLKKIDIGFVGVPVKLDKKIIINRIKNGYIPVISPLGTDEEKNVYNINADTVAGFVASSLKANKLLLLTDVSGVMNKKNKLITSLKLNKARKILKKDYITGGMKPKIETCINAIQNGVSEATILDGRVSHSLILELFTEHGIGTQIYK
ncbi:MAG: Acetylglutamate kinase [Alphaproteobacteria bacterium MarineAlpha5_Bin9]|nr:MAG: Acetylglutamate kinase [Alphaproteobacteria bacterium MarineAlpha5_Bin9]|tara:strand:+ start:2446 stop:3345 length:900 start_codon:yes stop_codon:yes gene_type:complete